MYEQTIQGHCRDPGDRQEGRVLYLVYMDHNIYLE